MSGQHKMIKFQFYINLFLNMIRIMIRKFTTQTKPMKSLE